MIIKYEKPVYPENFDPYEEDCCGSHYADTLTIQEDREASYPDGKNVKITIRESKSGIGDEFRIIIEGMGVRKEIITYVGDDGEFVCEMKGNDLD
jgi:hypothetical protein